MNKKIKLGVIGMPVSHSLSPQIHNQFALQFNHSINYQKYEVKPENLASFVGEFFSEGGVGLNVTVPHKQAVAELAEILTPEAELSGSVNTLFLDSKGRLVGDTTDGQGLLLDLHKLGLIVKNKRLLLLGAGGAARSIIAALLKEGATISIFNRTIKKAEQLVDQFSNYGDIKVADNKTEFEGVISSITQFEEELCSLFSEKINSQTFGYDLNYGHRAASFLEYMNSCGATNVHDGFGMLLGQAAHSYQRWTGLMPDVSKVELVGA